MGRLLAAKHLRGIEMKTFNSLAAFNSIRQVNRFFRHEDESNLWPINGKFNVTERAIRQLRKLRRDCPMDVTEYAQALDSQISQIVNNERNW